MTDHASTLFVAAGGGGDALAAVMVARALTGDSHERPGIATFVWERKLFDPRPGPRAPRDFDRLSPAGNHNHVIGPNSKLRRRDSHTFIPALARATDAVFYLIDASRGCVGVREQVRELVELRGSSRIVIVDVGGDILASGTEPGLRSPLADALVLGAVAGLPHVHVDVVTIGLGLDGELTQREWRRGVRAAQPRERRRLPRRTARAFAELLEWFPSEATGLVCLAVLGVRGEAEIRGEGLHVALSDAQTYMYVFAAQDVLAHNRVAQALLETALLRDADQMLRRLGISSEIAHERSVVARRRNRTAARMSAVRMADLGARLLRYSNHAAADGADFLTLRRVAEVLELDGADLPTMMAWLSARYPERLQPPVWHTRAASADRSTPAG